MSDNEQQEQTASVTQLLSVVGHHELGAAFAHFARQAEEHSLAEGVAMDKSATPAAEQRDHVAEAIERMFR